MPADMYLGRREEQEAAELAALQHQDSIPRSAAPLSCTCVSSLKLGISQQRRKARHQ